MVNKIVRSVSFYFFLISISLFCSSVQLMGQSSSFLGDGVQDFVRRQQLLGKVDLNQGLVLQSFSTNYKALDSLLPEWRGKRSSAKMQWLPVSITGGYNTHNPYGGNDGAMIPAAGAETLISGGFFMEAGKFSIQIKPEIVYAPNPPFETFSTEQYDNYWANYYQLLNNSDIPERFGNTAYHKIFPGQSSIRYSSGAISVGLSTENLCWGPGRYNSLIMSNNAPGFAHITLNTFKPIVTSIGSFEGQIIAGILTSSGITPPDTNRYYNQVRLYQAKREESRYIAGFTFSWQPKWVKGLFIGLTKASYLYKSDISGIADILPLEGIIRSNTEKTGQKASLGSLFARYIMPEDHAEIYFEFGRDDKSPSLINVLADKDYPRAYIAGVRKLFSTKKRNQFIEFASEFIQLELPTTNLVQESASWYTNTFVRQGFTNQGQVLGAGIGPGSNSQLIDISWLKGFQKVGLKFERLVHNNDFFYKSYTAIQDPTRHWVDISTTLHADWQYKRFLLTSQMALIRSLNYEWYVFPGLPYYKNSYDVLNFQAMLSVSYRL